MNFSKINYFNYFFYFNIIKYFNLIFFFKLKNTKLVKFNSNILHQSNLKTKKLDKYKKNYIFNYFNTYFFINIYKLDSKKFNFNKLNHKNLINILYNFNINNINYLVFDKYSNLHNLYTGMYGLKNLLIFKKYFYVDPKHFTQKNFIYFYNQFLVDNKIHFLIIFNIKNILRFSNFLENSNIILYIYNNEFSFYNDNYNFYLNFKNYFFYLYILLFNQIWFISINYKFYNNSIKYISFFKSLNI